MTDNSEIQLKTPSKKLAGLKLLTLIFSLFGIGLFTYFVYSVGLTELLEGIGKIGFDGFAIILFLYFLRIIIRAMSWKLSVSKPFELKLRDTLQGVIMGEAVSSVLPLGILASGTTKALAVKHRVPLVIGFSSVATENLFYSLATGLFIAFGAITFLRNFDLPENWVIFLDVFVVFIILLIVLGVLMVVRQWHWASGICNRIYEKGFLRGILENGRSYVVTFEDAIYGFYRQYPKRFFPIFAMQIIFHLLGITEVFFILSRLSEAPPTLFSAFLLETVSRIITIFFKLIPFVIGIDEAGSQFVTETLMLGAGLGVTIAIIRKGRILFWAICGMLLILNRGLSLSEITKLHNFNYFKK